MNFKRLGSALFVFSMGAVALIGCNKPGTSKVTITFDGNGGTVIPANDETSTTLEVNKGTVWKDITNKPTATKTAWTFDAWTSTKDDITSKIKDDYVFNNDVTLFACYHEESPAYEPEFRGDYKKEYNALDEFDDTNLEVYLHPSSETGHDNDIKIDQYDIRYKAEDNKLHVNNGAYVSFTYDKKDYSKDLPLTISPIEVDEPDEDETEHTYTGSEITYQVAASDDYTVSGNKQTNAGDYTVTIALNDKSGDHVWATSEDTDDLEYDFTIGKGTNAITGLATSYTTVCHTAPTISDVTSTFGTVQYDYWKKVGEAEETQVTVDQLEAAENTTYRVRAYVDGTGNYDAVEQYATLIVNHDWDAEYVPLDTIGYKKHECKICKKVEPTANLMADADCIFEAKNEGGSAKTTWGGTYNVIYTTETSPISWVGPNLAVDHTLVYVQDNDMTGEEKVKTINLPKVNYSLYNKVTFVCAQDSATKFPIQFKIGDNEVLPSQLRENYNFEVTYVPAAQGLGKIKVVGDDLTNNVQTATEILIDDSDIVTGVKSLALTSIDARDSGSCYSRAGMFRILLNHTCDPSKATEVLPTDAIGAYDLKCPDCGKIFAKSTEKFMTTEDVDLKHVSYGESMTYSAGQEHPEEAKCEVVPAVHTDPEKVRYNGIMYKADYVSFESTTISYTQKYDIALPKVQYNAYTKVEFDLVTQFSGWVTMHFHNDADTVACTTGKGGDSGVRITVTKDENGNYILTAHGYGTDVSDTFNNKTYTLTENEANGIDSVACFAIQTIISGGKALSRHAILHELTLTK